MTAFVHSMISIGARGLSWLTRWRFILIGLLVVGLGLLLGQSIYSVEQGELALSIVAVIALLVITLKEPLNSLLLLIVLQPFLEQLINIPMGAGIPDMSFSRFIIAFVSIAMLARAAIGRERIQPIGAAEFCILATTAGVMLAAPLSVFPDAKGVIQMSLSWYLQPMLAYFFAKNLVNNHDDLVRVFFAIGLLGFLSGVYAAYENATGNVLFVPRGRSVTDLSLVREELGIRMIRGIFGGTGTMGRVLVTAIPVTLYLYLEAGKHRIPRALLVVMLLAQFYGSVVAMSRTPWYSILIALFVMQLIYPKFRKMFLVIAFVAAIILAATWDQVADSKVASRVGDENSTLEGRQARWAAGLKMWRARPIRGWGFGLYGKESGRFRTDSGSTNFQAVENDYLMVLVSAGLIGFVPHLLTLIVPLLYSLRLLFKMRSQEWPGFIDKGTIATYWAILIVFAVGSYTAAVVSSVIKLLPFAVAGAVVGTHEIYLRRRRQPKGRGRARPGGQHIPTPERLSAPDVPKAAAPETTTVTATAEMPAQAPQIAFVSRKTRPLYSPPETRRKAHEPRGNAESYEPGQREHPPPAASPASRRTRPL